MGYIENFCAVLCAASVAGKYAEAITEWVFDGESFMSESSCICEHPIVQNMVVYNRLNDNQLIVGNCCIKKFGIQRDHYNKSPAAYLAYAQRKAQTAEDRGFLDDVLERQKLYPFLRIQPVQKQHLEAITGKAYRWKIEESSFIAICEHYTSSGNPDYVASCPFNGRTGEWCLRTDVPHYCNKYAAEEE